MPQTKTKQPKTINTTTRFYVFIALLSLGLLVTLSVVSALSFVLYKTHVKSVQKKSIEKITKESDAVTSESTATTKVEVNIPEVSAPAPSPETTTNTKPCYKLKITEERFKSDNCYTYNDRQQLQGHLTNYKSVKAVGDDWDDLLKDICEEITAFNEAFCENADKNKDEADDLAKDLENKINDLIKKGWTF